MYRSILIGALFQFFVVLWTMKASCRPYFLTILSPQGSASRIGGATMAMVAEEQFERHMLAYSDRECDTLVLRNPGHLHWRAGGEKHINDPDSVATLQV